MYDVLLLASVLIWTVPLSKVYRTLGPQNKNIYSILVTNVLVWISFGYGTVLNTLAIVICVWFAIKYLTPFDKTWKVLLVSGAVLTHLSIVQFYTMWYNYLSWRATGTGVLMIVAIKLTTFVWNYYDGCVEKKSELREDFRNNSVNYLPSLLEWMGWIYFLPGFLSAPITTFKEHTNYIHDTKQLSSIDTPDNNLRIIFYTSAMWCAFIYVLGMKFLPLDYILTSEFVQNGILSRMLYLYVSFTCLRCRYYFAWILAEFAFIESGANKYCSHQGKNVNILDIEFPDSPRQILNSWNVSTNEWLKNSVYLRAKSHNLGEMYAIVLTNVVSAVWHGFYPGYYLTFLFGGLSTYTHRLVRKHVSPRFGGGTWFNIISMVVCVLMINTIGLPFVFYTVTKTLKAWNNIYWIGIAFVFIGLVLGHLFKRIDEMDDFTLKKYTFGILFFGHVH